MQSKLTQKQIINEIQDMPPDKALSYLYDLKDTYGCSVDKLIEKYKKKKKAFDKEMDRLKAMCVYENKAYASGFKYVAGIDEAGRGPLAGPVVAAAVILPEGLLIEGVNDSKKLSGKKRELLFDIIKEKAIAYGIGIVDEKIIDEINILNATRKAMAIAVDALKVRPDFMLTDAMRIDEIGIPHLDIVKGDSKSISIAAASILAKVTSDRIMDQYDKKYPEYGFLKHKGYGTAEHINAIKNFGICPIHRITYIKNIICK